MSNVSIYVYNQCFDRNVTFDSGFLHLKFTLANGETPQQHSFLSICGLPVSAFRPLAGLVDNQWENRKGLKRQLDDNNVGLISMIIYYFLFDG